MARREDEELEEDLEDTDYQQKGRKRSALVDDEVEEDQDSDEDEDDRRQAKRSKRNVYIDDIAQVDDEDEEEDDDDDVDDIIEPDEGEELPDPADARHVYQANRDRGRDDMTAEELEAYVNERFRQPARAAADHGDGDAGLVGQQGLLPKPSDPRLWLLEVRPGLERQLVVQLLQRACQESLLIKSAFCQDHLSGYVYVEADKVAHVKEAVSGLRPVFHSKPIKQVPLKEMVDAVTVSKKAQPLLAAGAWVHVRNGPYKDDLARVSDVDFSGGKAQVKIVPRLDYAGMAQRKESNARAPPFGGSRTSRPLAKPFSPQEAKDHRLVVEQRRNASGGYDYFLANNRYTDGYMIRSFAIKSLAPVDGVPDVDELQRFNQVGQAAREHITDAGESQLAALVEGLGDASEETALPPLAIGDVVIVTEGDLVNLTGKVQAVHENGQVDVLPDMLELNQAVPIPARQLAKSFEAGDQIKVVAGVHLGQTGMVLNMDKDTRICVVLADATREEIKVLSRHLTRSAETSSTLDTFGEYSLHDLVVLDQQTMGVIVNIHTNSCQVLTNQGTPDLPDVRTCRRPDIKRKHTRRLETQDRRGATVGVGDMVTIDDGANKGKPATVKHVMKGSLFLHSKDLRSNGGFICVRGRSCTLRGTNNSSQPVPQLSRLGLASPAPHRAMQQLHGGNAVLQSPRANGAPPSSYGGATPSYMGTPGLGAGPGRGGPQPAGGFTGRNYVRPDRHALAGQTIDVVKGPHRGYRGRIVSATETHVRMELEAAYKTVTVKISDLRGQQQEQPRTAMQDRAMGPPPTPNAYATRTPMHGSATPMHPSMATPMHPSMATPRRDAWNPASLATPRHEPRYGSYGLFEPGYHSADTPNYQAAPTPGEGSGAPYSSGMTPGASNGLDQHGPTGPSYGSGRTPYDDSATPGVGVGTPAMGAGTPGMGSTPGFDAPYSPTGGDGPTPGMGSTPGFASTPGMAPTPYGSAATPGVDGYAPGGSGATGMDFTLWEDVLVRQEDGQVGIVRSPAASGECQLQLIEGSTRGSNTQPSDQPTVPAVASQLIPVQPEKGDTVRVLQADCVGRTATIVGLDGADGIVKLPPNEVKILQMRHMGVLVGQASAE